MPRRGGSAAKYGLRYEDRWTAYCATRILSGEASAIFLEEPGAEKEGFEFSLTTPGGIEYHQVKRQKSGEDRWTLKSLAEGGILGNFQAKLQDLETRCTFASGNAAGSLEELIDRASKFGDREPFRRDLQDNLTWKRQFEELCEIWNDPDGAWSFAALGRVEVSTINELELRRALQLAVELHLDGPPKPAPAALIEVIRDAVNERLEASDLWERLEPLGYGPVTSAPASFQTDIGLLNERFISSRTSTLIGGKLIARAETDQIEQGLLGNRLAFVQGPAGTGKSDVILEFCQRLAERGESFLALRLDRPIKNYSEGAGLGDAFGLETSPAAALSAAIGEGEGTLIIDQLDALSTTSGRRPEYLNSVEETVSVALANPQIRVVLACRTFDAENDARLREIAALAGDEDQVTVNVGLLSPATVEEALQLLDVEHVALSGSLKELLELPLHLWLLQSVAERNPDQVRNLRSVHDLYHYFWEEKRAEVDEILGRKSEWLAVIERLVDSMSDNHQLTAPKAIVDAWIDDVKAMLSTAVLVEDAENLAFFHETFFDYAYARGFVNRQKTLSELLHEDQFLFRRAQVRQILQFSRRSGQMTYREDLDFLLNSTDVRFHLKDLVAAWLGSLVDPDRADWDAVAAIVRAPEHELYDQVWRALCSAAWFRFLDGEALIESWLEDEEIVERAAFILIAAAEAEPTRVSALLSPYLDDSEEWNRRISGILNRVDVGAGRPLFELLLTLVRRGDIEGGDFWFSVHKLPEAEPEWACELLAAFLRKRIDASAESGQSNPFSSGAIPRDLHLQEYVVVAAELAPRAFVESIWPLFVLLSEANSKERYDEEHMYSDEIWMLRHFGDFAADLDEQLLIGIETALAKVAAEDPDYFESLLKEQWETQQETIAYLLFQGLAGNPRRFADLAIDFVLADKARFRVGHSDGTHWGTRRVLEAVTPHCSEETLERLERAVLAYTTSWERSTEGHAARGMAEFTLLGAIPAARLSMTAAARLAELRRKFEREDASRPTGIIAGAVGSPIGEEDAKKMSNENWLKAMRRYPSDDFKDRRELLIGGAHQLAGVLERLAKEDPLRFALLAAEQMEDDLNVAYFEAILRGVGQTEKDVPMDVAGSLVERCHRLRGHPCGRWIADPLLRLSDEEIPAEILEIVAWYAQNGEGASTLSLGDEEAEATGERLVMRGLNSVRGGTAHDITRIVAGHPSNLPPLLQAIRSLVNDSELGVRAMAAEIPLAVLRHDEDLARELFLEVVASDRDEILACRGVSEFLRYRAATDFERLLPVIERMLESDDEETRRLGAVQAALAALAEEQTQLLVDRYLESEAEFRIGIAQVFAHNVDNARYRSYCEENLRRLFDDPEPEVRKTAAGAIREMRNGGLEKLTDLVTAFIASRALEDDPEALMMAIEGADAPPPELSLQGAKAVLVALEEPSDIRRREAMIANEVVDIVLRAYVDAGSLTTKNEALDLFDAALRSNAYGARRALEDFDRG